MDISISKKIKNNPILTLQDFLQKSVTLHSIPLVDHDTITINKFKIIKENNYYNVIKGNTGQILVRTHTQSAAIAIVHSYLNHDNNFQEIIKLDREIEKNDIDSKFYRYSLKSNNNMCKDSLRARLDLSYIVKDAARKKIRDCIFSSIR